MVLFLISVTVAKPAPQDAPVKEMKYSGAAGPRFDSVGEIIPHSILGSVEDYTRMAFINGEMPDVSETLYYRVSYFTYSMSILPSYKLRFETLHHVSCFSSMKLC